MLIKEMSSGEGQIKRFINVAWTHILREEGE
jgi:hypothetical protein